MAGTSSTTFDPLMLMTRAMFVTALRAVRNSDSSTAIVLPFTDVPASEYYYEPVKWAYAAGITAGTSPTTFGSNDYVTREQMVQMLYRYAGSPVFTDRIRRSQYFVVNLRSPGSTGIVFDSMFSMRI